MELLMFEGMNQDDDGNLLASNGEIVVRHDFMDRLTKEGKFVMGIFLTQQDILRQRLIDTEVYANATARAASAILSACPFDIREKPIVVRAKEELRAAQDVYKLMGHLHRGQYRYVEYTDDGCSIYQCLWCKCTFETRDNPEYQWNFCPKCGRSWFKKADCRPRNIPRWAWDRGIREYPSLVHRVEDSVGRRRVG
jgi:hypothetical protein